MTEEPRFESTTVERRHGEWRALQLFGAWTALALFISAAYTPSAIAMWVLFAVCAVVAVLFARRPRLTRGELVAGANGVWFNDERIAKREAIVGGEVLPREGNRIPLVLTTRAPSGLGFLGLRSFLFLLPDVRTAEDFARATGTGRGAPMEGVVHRRIHLRDLGVSLLGFLPAFVAALFGESLPAHAIGAAMILGVLLFSSILAVRLRLHLTATKDGIRTRVGTRKAFIPWSEVVKVDGEGRFLVITTSATPRFVGGERPQRWLGFNEAAVRANNALVGRLMRGLAERDEDAADHDEDVVILQRGGRTPEEWLASLRRLAPTGHTGYRQVATNPDALAALVENGNVPRGVRVAAAVALKLSGDAAHVAALRAAATRIADPELPAMLEEIAAADGDAALTRVLGD